MKNNIIKPFSQPSSIESQSYTKQSHRAIYHNKINEQCSFNENKQNIDYSNIMHQQEGSRFCGKLAYTVGKNKVKHNIIPSILIKDSSCSAGNSDNRDVLYKEKDCVGHNQYMEEGEEKVMTERYGHIDKPVANQNIQTQRPLFSRRQIARIESPDKESEQPERLESAIENLMKLDRAYLIPLLLLFESLQQQSSGAHSELDTHEDSNDGELLRIVDQIETNIVQAVSKFKLETIRQSATQTQTHLSESIEMSVNGRSECNGQLFLANRLSQLKKQAELQMEKQTEQFQSKLIQIVQAVYALKSTIQELENQQDQTIIHDKQPIVLKQVLSDEPKNEHNLYHTPGVDVQSQADNQGSVRHSLQRWKRELQQLLSAITCREEANNTRYLQPDKQSIQKMNKSESKGDPVEFRQPGPNINKDMDVERSISDIKPFVIESCIRNQKKQGIKAAMNLSNTSICDNNQLNCQDSFQSLEIVNRCFKEVLAFALELLFHYLSETAGNRKCTKELVRKARNLYTQYKSMSNINKQNTLKDSNNLSNHIEQLKLMVSAITESTRSIRAVWISVVRAQTKIQ